MATKENTQEEDKNENKLKKEFQELQKEFAKQLLTLVTSGFGLVAALAWNEVIKEVITKYIQPIFGSDSNLISLLIYALFVTFLAVLITYQLSKLSGKRD
jgi:hypothetical protein